jgi:large subunit ribosomal protein L21
MFAIVSYKGKQYRVEEGKEYKIDLIDQEDDKEIVFSNILLVDDGKDVKVGNPYIAGATVSGEIVKDIKDDKVSGIKFHAKKHYKRNLGHRQQYTIVAIKKIKL